MKFNPADYIWSTCHNCRGTVLSKTLPSPRYCVACRNDRRIKKLTDAKSYRCRKCGDGVFTKTQLMRHTRLDCHE